MKVTGTLTMVKGKKSKGKKDKDGKVVKEVAGPFEMKVSNLKFWNDNPYFYKLGVNASEFLLKLNEPTLPGFDTNARALDEKRNVLLAGGTVQAVPFSAEYTASGTLDLKLLPEAEKPTKEDQEASAENLVRTERTPLDQPADTLPVDHNSKEFKEAMARVKSGKMNPDEGNKAKVAAKAPKTPRKVVVVNRKAKK